MVPILDGASGIVLLTLSVGLGAYIRQVYVGATDTYDEVNSGEMETLWPIDAAYTRLRLNNLLATQRYLRFVTSMMFFFITLVSLRVLISALNAIFNLVHPAYLCWYDLLLISYLSVAFIIMWRTHHYRKHHRE